MDFEYSSDDLWSDDFDKVSNNKLTSNSSELDFQRFLLEAEGGLATSTMPSIPNTTMQSNLNHQLLYQSMSSTSNPYQPNMNINDVINISMPDHVITSSQQGFSDNSTTYMNQSLNHVGILEGDNDMPKQMSDEDLHAYHRRQLDLVCAAFAKKYAGFKIPIDPPLEVISIESDGDNNGVSRNVFQSMNKVAAKGKEVLVSQQREKVDEKAERRKHSNKINARRSRQRKDEYITQLEAKAGELRERVFNTKQECAELERVAAKKRIENKMLKMFAKKKTI